MTPPLPLSRSFQERLRGLSPLLYRLLWPALTALLLAPLAAGSNSGVFPTDIEAIIRDLKIERPEARPFLTLREWMAECPAPPAGLKPERRAAFLRAWATLWRNTQPAQGEWWFRPIISPGARYSRGIWIWDTAYHVFALAHGGPKARQLGLWQIEVMLHGQHESGKIPREIFKDGPKFFGQFGIQSPGMLTMAANRLYDAATDDAERDAIRKVLADFYPRFVRNHEWFFQNTEMGRGLCTWTGSDAGWDDSPRWFAGNVIPFGAERRNRHIVGDAVKESLDLNCYLYLDRLALARMARILGRDGEAKAWEANATVLSELIRKFHWDAGRGIYNDTGRDGSPGSRVTPVIFWPLWAGIAAREQGRGVAALADDPEFFGARWPLSTVALSDPAYYPTGLLWEGQTWINVNWTAIRGLQRCGLDKEAAALRDKTLELVERTPVFHECYHPDTGAPLKDSHYGWTAACYIDLVLSPDLCLLK